MTELYVDLQGLSQVHRTLNRIRHDLADFDSRYAASHSEAMGHPQVIRSFEDFVYGWTDGRELIDVQLEVASAKIEGAVEAYNNTEQALGAMSDDMKGGMQ